MRNALLILCCSLWLLACGPAEPDPDCKPEDWTCWDVPGGQRCECQE